MDKIFKTKINKIKENLNNQEVFNSYVSDLIKKLEIEDKSDYEEIDNKKEDNDNKEFNNKDE